MKLSVVIPVWNEERNVEPLFARLAAVCDREGVELDPVFVDDGSTDGTLAILRSLAAFDSRVRYVALSRNFGHEAAVAAGLDRAHGDAVVLMDADLQDPPELIPRLLERWRHGAQVVYAKRRSRRGDSWPKRAAIYAFYRVLGGISEVKIPLDTGNFRLMDRCVADVVRQCRENPRFVRGLVPWAGFRQEAVEFDRDRRLDGRSGYGMLRLVRLAIDGICTFSVVPLRLSTWIGLAVIVLASGLGLWVVVEKLLLTDDAPPPMGVPRGFAFLACVMLFLGGVQLFMLGMLATYVGYILKNVQGRPMYVVAEDAGGGLAETGDASVSKRVRPTIRDSSRQPDQIPQTTSTSS